jgi:hypothetical protein
MDAKQQQILAERYGAKPRRVSKRSRIFAIVAVSFMTVIAGLLGLANWSPIQATDIGFRVLSPWQTELDFELQMPTGRLASCEFEALNNNFGQVGYLTLDFGPFEQDITSHTVSINTYEEAVTGLVRGCELR